MNHTVFESNRNDYIREEQTSSSGNTDENGEEADIINR